MHYALYRKYRPSTFGDVTGQEHITKTLKRQISDLSFSHAYLFCGTRGTGKTSCAKIFSRAINCLSPKDGEPCNECEICRGIADGSIFDVTEIDAASNNGVDDIRTIRDEIVFAPVSAKFRVYIIDEVHMLSTAAFNALLKTLEEPPSHAVFILATTEPHKIPATILSRCQRYDFNRLSIKTIAEHLEKIAKAEGKTLGSQTLYTIADAADGSVRDGISILEKALETEGTEDIENLLGMIGRATLYKITEAIAAHDTDTLFETVSELYVSSKDLTVLIKELTALFREIMIAKTSRDCAKILDRREDDIAKIVSLSEKVSVEYIVYAMQTLQATAAAMAYSQDKRAEAELCMLKMSKPQVTGDLAALAARLEALENKINSGNFSAARPSSEPKINPELKKERTAPTTAPEKRVEKVPTKNIVEDLPEPPPPETYLPVPPEPEEYIPEEPIPQEHASTEPKPTEKSAPEKAADAKGGEEWHELSSWFDIAGDMADTNKLVSVMLQQSCRAVYRGKEAVILCPNDFIRAQVSKSLDEIRHVFEKNRRTGYTIKTDVCSDITKYISPTSTYENAESSGMFGFDEN